jgi:hypothetical protein
MADNTQSISKLVSMFGPGAMVDLPNRSVIVGGLEQWDMRPGSFTVLNEPRLTLRLEKVLKTHNRLDESKRLSLRTPPNVADNDASGVRSAIFPYWFVCARVEPTANPSAPRRRRLVHWRDLDSRHHLEYVFEDGKKSTVTPIRFVAACEMGHIQDIDWKWAVHGPTSCSEPLWIEEKGTSAVPSDTSVVCGCGRRITLEQLEQKGRLGRCHGERPWLLDKENACQGREGFLRLLIRTATNTYFPQILNVISLPSGDEELTKTIADILQHLDGIDEVADVKAARKHNHVVKAALEGFSDADVFERLKRIREGGENEAELSPKLAEFDIFASGRAEIGTNGADARLYAQTLPRDAWDPGDTGLDFSVIRNVIAVHRLQEVSCLYGFTRFEAAPTSIDGDIEDINLAVHGASLSKDADWLPAVTQLGEGIFIHFDQEKIRDWLADRAMERDDQMRAGYQVWRQRFKNADPGYPSTPYVLLHSISHALMAEIALDCGYPASSLKERIYALGEDGNGERVGLDGCGILIYTASPGAQGTLGGLVATATRFSEILKNALGRLQICSNDPVCSDHQPENSTGDRAAHGAACHGCLLIAETSCEYRNLFLDRSLVVPTMTTGSYACFEVP